jgi:hypothetical protein
VTTIESVTAARWDVSIPQGAGPSLELRAARTRQDNASPAAWSLQIRAGARDLSSALSRTASRLSDRLGARSVSAHVRIERDDDQDAQ